MYTLLRSITTRNTETLVYLNLQISHFKTHKNTRLTFGIEEFVHIEEKNLNEKEVSNYRIEYSRYLESGYSPENVVVKYRIIFRIRWRVHPYFPLGARRNAVEVHIFTNTRKKDLTLCTISNSTFEITYNPDTAQISYRNFIKFDVFTSIFF